MALEATRAVAFLLAPLAVSAGCVVLLSWVAPAIGLLDHPGGRKAHAHAVPLVGGLSVFVTLLAFSGAVGIASKTAYFLFALSIVIAVGLWDDVADLRPRLKMVIEAAACCVVIWGGDTQLHAVGNLFGVRSVGLWVFAVPLTLFAVVGVVNAINMMDGIDGLTGSLAIVAFAWFALVAYLSGLETRFEIALILCGSLAGFLLFNLRFPWQPRARVFLGDAGSLMVGFALAWFAIDLTQGTGRSFPPIAAIWVLLVPLVDCVSLMARRLRAGRSPFVADCHHIHHYLLARGYTHGRTLAILVGASTLFGAIGVVSWRISAPEPLLFWTFFFGFFWYHFWIQRAWVQLEHNQRLQRVETGAFAPMPGRATEEGEEIASA